jgi:hypothetical protein
LNAQAPLCASICSIEPRKVASVFVRAPVIMRRFLK